MNINELSEDDEFGLRMDFVTKKPFLDDLILYFKGRDLKGFKSVESLYNLIDEYFIYLGYGYLSPMPVIEQAEKLLNSNIDEERRKRDEIKRLILKRRLKIVK